MKASLVAAGLVGGVIGGVLVWEGQRHSFAVVPVGMSYQNFVSVMLTGVTVLLAVAALGLGAMAFWGWATFKGMTQEAAGTAALGHIKSDDGTSVIRVVVERVAIQFLQENLRNGNLLAYAEQRNSEEDRLREVDEDWGAVATQEPDHAG